MIERVHLLLCFGPARQTTTRRQKADGSSASFGLCQRRRSLSSQERRSKRWINSSEFSSHVLRIHPPPPHLHQAKREQHTRDRSHSTSSARSRPTMLTAIIIIVCVCVCVGASVPPSIPVQGTYLPLSRRLPSPGSAPGTKMLIYLGNKQSGQGHTSLGLPSRRIPAGSRTPSCFWMAFGVHKTRRYGLPYHNQPADKVCEHACLRYRQSLAGEAWSPRGSHLATRRLGLCELRGQVHGTSVEG